MIRATIAKRPEAAEAESKERTWSNTIVCPRCSIQSRLNWRASRHSGRKMSRNIEDLQKSHGDLSKRLSAAEARLEEREKAAGKEFENEASVVSALSEADEKLQASRAALEAATERRAQRIRLRTSRPKRLPSTRRKPVMLLQKKPRAKKKNGLSRLDKGGFKSEKAFVAADLPDESRV